MLPPFMNHEPLITVPHALVSPKLISTFSLGVLGGLVNGRAYIRGAYNWNRKSPWKQVIAVVIKIYLAFTGRS